MIVSLIAAAGAGVATYLKGTPVARGALRARLGVAEPLAGDLKASGFIEAEEVSVAAELGGRVVELLVEEGDQVEAGETLLRLDGTLLDARIEAARADLDVAQARLAHVLAGAQPEEIDQLKAALAQAEAVRDGARQARQDLIAIRDNPQELDAQIAQARTAVVVAQAGLVQAIALKDAAEIAQEAYFDGQEELARTREILAQIPAPNRPSLPGTPLEAHLVPNAYWRAWVGVNSAQAGLDGAQAFLRDLSAIRSNPQAVNAQVDAAEAAYRAAEASVRIARAQLDALQAGATTEEIAALTAQVGQAEAARAALLLMRDKQTIAAPLEGTVLALSIRRGELAFPGATVLALGDLDDVVLTVFVPVGKLGQVHIGQPVAVHVDSHPDRQFSGTVEAIAHEAEFTPRNVQTQEQRADMVFAVDVALPNLDHALKPGVPADAEFFTQDP